MREIIALASKDIKLLLRDKAGFFFTFFFPLIIAIFFGAVFSGGSGKTHSMPVLVVDEDSSEKSGEFVKTLQDAEELQVTQTTREDAASQVRLGKAVAFIVLMPGFGESQSRIFWGDPPKIELGVDPARSAESGMLQGILMKYAVNSFQKTFSDKDAMHTSVTDALDSVEKNDTMDPGKKGHLQSFLGELDTFMSYEPEKSTASETPGETTDESGSYSGFQPVVIEKIDISVEHKGPKNPYAISFPQGIIWGILGCAAAFGISLVVERSKGTLVRLLMSPISRSSILAGKALACLVTTLAVTSSLLFLGIVVFKLRPESYALLAMAVMSVSLGFVGLMMLLSVLGKTEQAAGGIGWAVLIMMSMFGGGMIPLFFMPRWMQSVSHLSPVKWSILALEGALWRGFTFREMLTPCAILLTFGLVSFVIGIRAFQWSSE